MTEESAQRPPEAPQTEAAADGQPEAPSTEAAPPDGQAPTPPAAETAPPNGQADLEREHQLDDVDRYDPPGEVRAAGGTEVPADDTGLVPPPRAGLPRRTRILGVALVGSLFFMAGLQCQKLAGGGPTGGSDSPGVREPGPPRTPAPGESSAPASTLTRGEIVAIRDGAVYVRDPGGATIKVTATAESLVARGDRVPLDGIRPGETVVVEAERNSEGKLEATSITVLPPRSGPGAR